MSQHTPTSGKSTPGPWKAVKGEVASSSWYVVQATKPRRNRMIAPCGDAPQGEANARLIAAAPEMLAFIKKLLVSMELAGMKNEATREARALLARMEGE